MSGRLRQRTAALRVCASCEWIFKRTANTERNGCPRCLFGHYGARYVYGNAAYRYAKTQAPWFRKQMAKHAEALRSIIRSTST